MARFIDAFRSRRIGVMPFLGLASGMPNPAITSTLTYWLATHDIDKTTLGLFALVSVPYNFKFVWAPFLDRFAVPFLGRRRGWMVLSQLALLAGLVVLGTFDPREALRPLAIASLVVAFFSASQDIVQDAYRTDVLPEHERASGAAIFVAGYRVALIVAGGGALVMSDYMPWRYVYWTLGALMLVGVVATVVAPEPEEQVVPPRSMQQAVVDPFVEFFRRHGVTSALLTLGIIFSYKVGDAVAGHLLSPFLRDVGFTGTEIGTVQKGLGFGASIVGSLLGGGLVARFGLRRSLLAFGVLQAVANAMYAWLAVAGKSYPLFLSSIGIDQFCNGLGTAAFIAYLMTLCNKRYTAFQYALFSSVMSLGGRLVGGGGGAIADHYGWVWFFVVTILAAVPALLLLALRPIAEPDREQLAAAADLADD